MYAGFISYLEGQFKKKLVRDIYSISTIDEANKCIMETFGVPIEDYKLFDRFFLLTEESMKIALKKYEQDIVSVSNDIYRVCSLSATFNSNTMWSHYADEHKGVCLGYGIKELQNDITELTFPVRYSDQMIEMNPDLLLKSSQMDGNLQLNALSMKSVDWEYEEEWRIIVGKKDNNVIEKVYLPVLKEIILGVNTSEENFQVFKKIAFEKKANIYRMTIVRGSFKLEKVQIM